MKEMGVEWEILRQKKREWKKCVVERWEGTVVEEAADIKWVFMLLNKLI